MEFGRILRICQYGVNKEKEGGIVEQATIDGETYQYS